MYKKINAAKTGATVYIYPDDLADVQDDDEVPLTIEDLISMCASFNLQYTLTDQYFKIFKTA